MANLQIKGMDEQLYEEVRKLAAAENRSVSQQVLFLLKQYLARRRSYGPSKTHAQVLLDLSGSWEDEREADQILRQIKDGRRSTKRLKGGL